MEATAQPQARRLLSQAEQSRHVPLQVPGARPGLAATLLPAEQAPVSVLQESLGGGAAEAHPARWVSGA